MSARRSSPLAQRGRGSVLAMVLLALTTGCGIPTDANVRDVPDENLAGPAGISSGGDASGAQRIYLVGPGEDRLLRSVARDPETNSATELLRILMLGPNEDEVANQYGSAIPAGLDVLSTRTQGSLLTIDVSGELRDLSGVGLVQALAQIVYTASEIEGVQSVKITSDGEQLPWPTADLDAKTAPLTVYDYPGLVRSAQPAYPALPSGG